MRGRLKLGVPNFMSSLAGRFKSPLKWLRSDVKKVFSKARLSNTWSGDGQAISPARK